MLYVDIKSCHESSGKAAVKKALAEAQSSLRPENLRDIRAVTHSQHAPGNLARYVALDMLQATAFFLRFGRQIHDICHKSHMCVGVHPFKTHQNIVFLSSSPFNMTMTAPHYHKLYIASNALKCVDRCCTRGPANRHLDPFCFDSLIDFSHSEARGIFRSCSHVNKNFRQCQELIDSSVSQDVSLAFVAIRKWIG